MPPKQSAAAAAAPAPAAPSAQPPVFVFQQPAVGLNTAGTSYRVPDGFVADPVTGEHKPVNAAVQKPSPDAGAEAGSTIHADGEGR